MDSGWVLVAGLAILVFGCGPMVLTVLLINAALSREVAAVRAGRYPAEIGYQRYLGTNLSVLRFTAPFALLVPVILVVVLASNTALLNPAATPDQGASDLLSGVLALVGVAFALPVSTYELLGAFVGQRALRELRGSQLSLGESLMFRAKRILISYVPSFIFLEATAVAAKSSLASAIIVALVGLVVLLAVYRLLGPRLRRWYVTTSLIERTQWAALAPRIQEWARLAGTPLGTVYVQQTERLGSASIAGYGLRRRSITVSDKLLANTDWRQQDALIALSLFPINRRLARRRLLRTIPVLAVVVLVFGVVTIPGLLGQSSTAVLGGAFVVYLLLPTCLAVFLFGLAIYNVTTARKRLREPFFAADRFAAELTGDPMALMVALSTVATLNGLAPDRRVGYYPSTAERVAALDGLMRQAGPRAPWAHAPVPAVAPVWQGPYCLTVPLQAAPPAAPVPAVRYPVASPYVGTPAPVPPAVAATMPPAPPA